MTNGTEGERRSVDGEEPSPGTDEGSAAVDRQTVRRAVGHDSDGGDVPETFEGSDLDVSADDVSRAYGGAVSDPLVEDQATVLSTLADDGPERTRRVAAAARAQAAQAVTPREYAATYAPALESLVEEAFDAVDDGADPEDVKQDLVGAVRSTMVDVQVGLETFRDPLSRAGVSTRELFDAIPYPAFAIDDDHTVLEYNTGLNRLISLPDDHREFLGGDNRETISAATYSDGKRHRSLVDKVAENPRDAHEQWDVERVDGEHEYTDHPVYRDESVTHDTEGNETHISFLAIPMFDDEGEVKAVFEVVQDRTEEIRRQAAVSELVTEVTDTLDRIGAGDLSARATFEDDRDALDPELLALTDDVNAMAEDFEALVERVDDETAELAASIDRASDSARTIRDQIDDQTRSLGDVADEMADFSATMEEVAATSDEVATAVDRASEAAHDGVESGRDARAATDDLAAIGDDLVETVERLDEYMTEIGEVVDVIADIADQTNLLALNANIEAAHAGSDGAGFAVVADEVKDLAEETQRHTEEIEEQIDEIQAQATETVDSVDDATERIREVDDEIGSALDSLDRIAAEVDEAADGVQEVSDANDRQAATIEEVMSTVENVRSDAEELADTAEEIADEAGRQERTVEQLADRVDELSTR